MGCSKMKFTKSSSGLVVPDRGIIELSPDELRRSWIFPDLRKCPPLPDVGRLPFRVAATIDSSASTDSGGSGSATTLTLSSLTIGASANLLLVHAGTGNGSVVDPSALTVDGVSIFANVLWNIGNGNWVRSKMFYQKNPTAGAKTIVVTCPVGVQLILQAVSLIGADVAGTTFGTASTASGISGTTAQVAVTSSSGLVIFGLMSDAESGITPSGNNIQTSGVVASDTIAGMQYYTTANPTGSWTQGASDGWAIGGVGINGVTSGSARIAQNTQKNQAVNRASIY